MVGPKVSQKLVKHAGFSQFPRGSTWKSFKKKKATDKSMHLVMQGQGTLALSIVDACLHEAGIDLAAATVTTSIITFLVGNPYKPSFATVTERATSNVL